MDIQSTITEVKGEYKNYLRKTHPDWADSTVSTHVSDASYLYQNTIALSFWKCFADDSSVVAAQQDLFDYLKNEVMSERTEERAKGYYKNLTMLKEFIISNGYIGRSDVDQLLSVSQASANRTLKRMAAEGLIYRDGSGRKTRCRRK